MTDLGLTGVENSKEWGYFYNGYSKNFSVGASRYSGATLLGTYYVGYDGYEDGTANVWSCGMYGGGFKPIGGVSNPAVSTTSSASGCTI